MSLLVVFAVTAFITVFVLLRRAINVVELCTQKCSSCGRDGGDLPTCSGCRRATYCNADCQKVHRPLHRRYCKERELEIYRESFRHPTRELLYRVEPQRSVRRDENIVQFNDPWISQDVADEWIASVSTIPSNRRRIFISGAEHTEGGYPISDEWTASYHGINE